MNEPLIDIARRVFADDQDEGRYCGVVEDWDGAPVWIFFDTWHDRYVAIVCDGSATSASAYDWMGLAHRTGREWRDERYVEVRVLHWQPNGKAALAWVESEEVGGVIWDKIG